MSPPLLGEQNLINQLIVAKKTVFCNCTVHVTIGRQKIRLLFNETLKVTKLLLLADGLNIIPEEIVFKNIQVVSYGKKSFKKWAFDEW